MLQYLIERQKASRLYYTSKRRIHKIFFNMAPKKKKEKNTHGFLHGAKVI